MTIAMRTLPSSAMGSVRLRFPMSAEVLEISSKPSICQKSRHAGRNHAGDWSPSGRLRIEDVFHPFGQFRSYEIDGTEKDDLGLSDRRMRV